MTFEELQLRLVEATESDKQVDVREFRTLDSEISNLIDSAVDDEDLLDQLTELSQLLFQLDVDYETENDELEDALGEKYKVNALTVNSRPAYADPTGLNFKTGLKVDLHEVIELTSGLLTEKNHYLDRSEDGEYSNLIVSEFYEWETDEDGNPTYRKREPRWVKIDGEYGSASKIKHKHYPDQESALAGARRRKNIVDGLTSQAKQFGALSYVQTMFKRLVGELNSYKETGDKSLITKIESYDGQWLESPYPDDNDPDFTLRKAIVRSLTI